MPVNNPLDAEAAANPLEVHLGYWLRLVSNRVSGSFASALQERQLSVAEWVALNHVDKHPEITAAALADAMGMTRGAISKVLDKLQARQWLVRSTSQHDNRVQLLALTRSGRRVLPPLKDIADCNDEHFFAVLGTTERVALRRLLQKLANAHRINKPPVD